jgi:hypothetical protein
VRLPEQCRAVLTAALLLAASAALLHAATPPAASTAPIEGPMTRDEIRGAVAGLAADPNLSGETKVRELRWINSDPKPKDPVESRRPPERPSWTKGFFDFLAQSMRVILWALGIVAIAFAAVFVIRWLRALPPAVEPDPPAKVQSVSGLDIRPASLPEDIGAAALALARALRTREALSLLYRGALSRAVHRYGAAIGAAYTEGEALRAVNARLDPSRAAYVASLVSLWQRTVYAGQTAAQESVEQLCRGFAEALDGAAP